MKERETWDMHLWDASNNFVLQINHFGSVVAVFSYFFLFVSGRWCVHAHVQHRLTSDVQIYQNMDVGFIIPFRTSLELHSTTKILRVNNCIIY